MSKPFQLAEFLISAWKIGARDNEKIPTSHGLLDRALGELKDDLPEPFRGELTFGTTRLGYRCYELPEVLYAAQANLLTSQPNPTYTTTQVQIDRELAYSLIFNSGVDVFEAEDFGRKLSDAVDKFMEVAA